jgi:predicted regulator of Ras-like GTPase activity (Roadblock/LC7/MglB family)
MEEILRKLQAETPGIEAVTLTSIDGLIITSVLSSNVEEDKIAAIAASLLGLGESGVNDLNRSDFEYVVVKGKNGHLVVTKVGREAIIAVVTNHTAKLGTVLWDVKVAVEELQKMLK